ncbi:MAG TPA: hypothetical protein VKM94_18975 [Blastocatellia bacterium]|nr:hypothetical protein [Blastocatellia bacterium]
MLPSSNDEYSLTIVQHTYCPDCMWVKGKITDVYHASGIVRGEDSKYWRVQIISPPWDREARKSDFPSRFQSVDVPAIKLEAGNRLVFATQNPALINDLLVKMKWLLINRLSNVQIEAEVKRFIGEWTETPTLDVCVATR